MDNKGEDLVFIVGPARSGTKLLQGILNQSDRVSIGPESHIFPKLLRDHQGRPPAQDAETIGKILRRSNYFLKLQRNGFTPDLDQYIQRAESIEALIHRLIRDVGLWQNPEAELFGDKTPTYALFIELLKARFPKALFVAILRDPRDRSLSVASSWGKSPLLAAHEWKRPARSILEGKKQWQEDTLLIHYEELLEDPEETVKDLSSFLGIPYDRKLLEADSSEKRGSGQGIRGVLPQNKEKFWTGMKQERIRRIEELLYHELLDAGYSIHYANGPRPMSSVSLFFLKVGDFFKNIRFHLKERGLLQGTRYMISLRRDKLK